tara:strand:- start:3401 stop:3901 length:501 start_codon:yes stop_codon:yes gene_type:complete
MGKMRFRKLSKIELEALSEELIQFLVVQGIDDDLWRDINKNYPQKAEELVALFSDTVLQKVYAKVQYLSFISEQVFSIFKIQDEEIVAIVIKNKSKTLAFKDLQSVLDRTSKNTNDYEVLTATRSLGNKILDEIHTLSENGCLVADEELWQYFKKFHKNLSNQASF